jgi:broad specificity phosphatase PhoE
MPETGNTHPVPDTDIFLARHGETEWSRDGRHTGLTDVPLTDVGRDQAEALGPRFAGLEPALVLSSPLSRALETCRLAGLGEHAVEEPDLVEWDYGDYEGITTDQVREERPDWTVFRDGCPGGESPEEIAARADRVVQRLREADGLAVAFAHGHILRVLAARWIGLEAGAGAYLALSTATLSGLGWEREQGVVTLWNDGGHLG